MDIDINLPDGPVTYLRLRELGLSDRRIRNLVRSGTLRRILRGVYGPGAAPDTVELHVTALGLVVAACHVVVDRTAARLHEVDVFTLAEHEIPPPVETCALRGNHPTERSDVRGRSRDLLPRDIMDIGGLMVTTPARTSMDLGCNLHRRDAYAAMNEFARLHRVTRARLEPELPRFKGRRGVVQLKELLPLVEPRVESIRESWTLLAILDAGLPAPEPQVWVEVDGVTTYRLDFAYPQHRICVEYDGVEAHLKTAEQRTHDEKRRRWLRAHGWVVIVVALGDFTEPRLSAWLGEIREALSSRYTNRRW